MFKPFLSLGVVALVGSLACASAGAAVITGSQIALGAVGSNTYVDPVSGLTFMSAPRPFAPTKKLGIVGVGVSGGATGDEIDVGETVTMSGLTGFVVSSITLGVLYEGPEYNDVPEIAQFLGTPFGGGAPILITFRTIYSVAGTLASLDGPGTWVNLSPALGGATDGGVWKVSNPFGNVALSSVVFSALTNIADTGQGCPNGGGCTNQSDYAIVAIQTVPEPGVLARLGLGVLGLAASLRTRRR